MKVSIKYAGVKANAMDVVVADDDGILVIFRRMAEIVVQIAGEILKIDYTSRAK